jgi:hypothetical protein
MSVTDIKLIATLTRTIGQLSAKVAPSSHLSQAVPAEALVDRGATSIVGVLKTGQGA